MFLNVVNTEGKTKITEYIRDIHLKSIEEIGPQNVMKVNTINAPVCKIVRGEVEIRYPCMVSLNLTLKNICVMKNTEVNEVVYEECSWITKITADVVVVRNLL